jgi:hypothetical protein
MTRLRPLAGVNCAHLLYLRLFVLDILCEVYLSVAFFPVIILSKSARLSITLAHFDLGKFVDTGLIEHDFGGGLFDGAANSSISETVSKLGVGGALTPSEVDLWLGSCS